MHSCSLIPTTFPPFPHDLTPSLSCLSLQSVSVGDEIFIGQYLFTGSETTSVWLEVGEEEGRRWGKWGEAGEGKGGRRATGYMR